MREERAEGTIAAGSHSAWLALGVLGAAVTLFFVPGLFQGKVPVFRDLLVLVIPLRRYAALAIRSGELPLWNPDLFLGAPFLANYQSAVLYPPSAIFYVLPFPESLSVFLALHLLLAGSGMALYLRRAHGLEPSSALFGGITFSFGGFFVSLIPLVNQLEVAAWTPWVLLAGRELAATGALRWFAAVTLLFAFQALGGAPEGAILTLVLLAADCGREWRRVPQFGAALGLAFALSAVQLLPTLEYARETDRALGLPYGSVVSESLRPSSFLQLVLPHVFTDGAPGFVPEGGVPLFWSLYLGVVPLSFAIVGLVSAPLSRWSFLLFGGIALALGGSTPIFPFLYAAAPRVIGLFRYPGKFFLVAHVAAAVLAARGLERVAEERTMRPAMAALGVLVVLSAALAAWASADAQSFVRTLGFAGGGLAASTYDLLAAPPQWSAIRTAMLSVAALGVAWLFARRGIDRRGLAAALIAVALADLWPVHAPMLAFTDWKALDRSVDVRGLGLLAGERIFHYCVSCVPAGAPGFGAWNGTLRPLDRVETRARGLWAALVPDVPIVYGLGAVAGVDGWSTRDREELYRLLALLPRDRGVKLLASFGVTTLIGPSAFDDPSLHLVSRSEGDDPSWRYAVPDAAPRVYLAERIAFAPDARSALERAASPDFRPGRDAVVLGLGHGATEDLKTGSIETTEFDRELVRATVDLPAGGLLVVSDSWYPGWSASIDGIPTEIVRANGIVRGVYVGPGRHDVEMRYSPASFRIGWRISLAAAALFGSIILLARFRPGESRSG